MKRTIHSINETVQNDERRRTQQGSVPPLSNVSSIRETAVVPVVGSGTNEKRTTSSTTSNSSRSNCCCSLLRQRKTTTTTTELNNTILTKKSSSIGQTMLELQLNLSYSHYTKFLQRKAQLKDQFSRLARYQAYTANYAAIVLSEEFCYLHIWKSGGTTVELQIKQQQRPLSDPEVQRRKWITFVRDPIDHFLSGWAEVGERWYGQEAKNNGRTPPPGGVFPDPDESQYDDRIRTFLQELCDLVAQGPRTPVVAHVHALPQANFMLNSYLDGAIYNQMQVVGDIREMPQLLQMIGVLDDNYDEFEIGRDRNKNEIKSNYFPSRRDWLSNETILSLCQFLAMDYFLFDFLPPPQCVGNGGPLDFSVTYPRNTY